jgi:Family of unknown function (DUF6152)
MTRKPRAGVALVALLAFALPALAHHSFTAEFDGSRTVSVRGTITKVDWINPHVYVYLDSKDDNGNVTSWSFETLPTGFLHTMKITKEFVEGNPGEIVTVTANPAKDSTKTLGWIVKIAYPDGREFTPSPKTPTN